MFFGITFIRYVRYQKIGKPNNLSLWEQITIFQDYDILKDLFLSLKVYV